MAITIEPVKSRDDEIAVMRIRRQVFEIEMAIAIPELALTPRAGALHLLARVEPDRDPAGVLSIIDTSGDDELHCRYGIRAKPGAKVARYTQLAVLRPYRGMNIPIMMILEAHRRFIEPEQVTHTWLLFDARRAESSFLCRRLGFIPMETVSLSEYGRTCALVRDESQMRSRQALIEAQQYVEDSAIPLPPPGDRAALDRTAGRINAPDK